MGRLFAVDGKINTLLGRAADLVILNLLWLLCSIPIVTIGASTTALYSVVLKMTKNEDAYIFQSFMKAFKDNFRQAALVWIGILFSWVVLYFDFYFCSHAAGGNMKYFAIPLGMAAFITLMLYSYVFPILAYFENSTKKAIKNALLMAVVYLPYTIVFLFVNACPFLLLFAGNLIVTTFIDIVIGFAFAAFVNAYLFRKLFDKVYVEQKEAR